MPLRERAGPGVPARLRGIGKSDVDTRGFDTRDERRSQTRAWVWMVLVALLLRLVVAGFLYPSHLNPARDYWKYAGEVGRIARSLVEGQGFSNPLFGNTGPTAWLTPVFPALVAGIFKLMGIYTKASLFCILCADCLFGALTCIPVYSIALHSFGARTALLAGWAWALFPYSIYFSADFIWPTTLATLLLSIAFLLALRLEGSGNAWEWASFGAAAGVAALTDPIVMSVLPVLGAWMCYRRWRRRVPWFWPALAAVLVVIAIIAPWTVRNYEVFHKLIALRGNFGFELYCGNNKDDWHWGPPGYHPSDNEAEWREFQELGEAGYVAEKGREARTYIAAHPAQYLMATLRRFVYIWTGFWSFERRYLVEEPFDPANVFFCTGFTLMGFLGLWRSWREDANLAVPYLLVFLFFPIIYYLTHPEDYHRRPIDPMMVVLGAYAFTAWREARAR